MSKIRLGDIATIYSGGTPSRGNPKYWNGEIPWVKTAHIQGNTISREDIEESITEQGLKNSSTKIAPVGTILMAMYGQGQTRGQVALLKVNASINQACCAIEIFSTHCLEYVFQYLRFNYGKIRNLSNDGSQKNINAGIIKNLYIYLPSFGEQKAIADTLQTWDTAIEKTEALIAAKERQFGWFVKSLMSNSNNSWNTSLLNKVAKIKKGQQINRDTLEDSGSYAVWNGGITPSGYTDKYNTTANTITISEGGNSCGFVNFCAEQFWLSGHCYAVTNLSNIIDTEFLYHFLKMHQKRIMRLRVGSGLPNIQKKDIDKFEIKYLPISEQKAIANKLNTAKKEIDLLNDLTEHYRTQKRGLMQKLLTGNWRMKL